MDNNNSNGKSEASEGFRHVQTCRSNLGAMVYDPSCVRCSKISKVIMLKRKNPRNGCTQQETLVAMALVTKLVDQYRLTGGEIFDREYDYEMITRRKRAQAAYHKTYGAAAARPQTKQRWSYKARVRHTKMSQFFNDDEEMDDDLSEN